MFAKIEPHKSLVGKDSPVGLAIGNVTSQTLANFVTTEFLRLLEALNIKFVCYTDDVKGVVQHKSEFLKLRSFFTEFCWHHLRLRLHPKKFNIQHYSKGIRIGAFKLRFDRVLPNDRVAHNWLYKTKRFINLINTRPNLALRFLERVMCTCNSYLGMLKWCNSYRLRSQGVDSLNNSAWIRYIYFNREKLKVTIRYRLQDKVTARSRVRIRKFATEEILTKAA